MRRRRAVLFALGGGAFEASQISLTTGLHLGVGSNVVEALARRFEEVADRIGDVVLPQGMHQSLHEVTQAQAAHCS